MSSDESGRPAPRRPVDIRRKTGRLRRSEAHICPMCKVEQRMFRRCRCGFEMCQACMDENAWGLTCNDLTWTCPDCGEQNSF